MEKNKKTLNLIQALRRTRQKSGGDFFGQETLQAQLPLIIKLYKKNGLELVMTCGACPEQYDVLEKGVQVAYYRLRHGGFRVDFPVSGGETIYSAEPKGDGVFDTDERFFYLNQAMKKVLEALKHVILITKNDNNNNHP